jgi:phosphoesterase RecJ-like protein
MEPTREEAELLFFGLCTDTCYFRHVDSAGAETFEDAAALIRCGANPKAAYAAIHGGKSLDSRRLIGLILNRAESLYDGRLILSSEEYEETCRFGPEGRDSDSLYQLLQSVAGVEAIVIIRQETPENCTVGFRSRDRVNVAAIARSFGGGGHKNAAGLSIKGTIADLKPLIIKAFEKAFPPLGKNNRQ